MPDKPLTQRHQKHYQAIVADIEARLETYPPHLRTIAQHFFAELWPGEFSQVVALLPYWVADLAPVSPQTCHCLGVTHLYGWWYYAAQDEMLDQQAEPRLSLAAHLALLDMVAGYRRLGITQAPIWAEYERLAVDSAEHYALELSTRFNHWAELTPDRLLHWTVELIIARAGPFYFNTMAQCRLAGIPADSPLNEVLINALAYFGAARQINDDAADWLNDLQQGQLNYVSAQFLLYLHAQGIDYANELDLHRLAGRQLTADDFWAEMAHQTQSLTQQALDCLQPYGPCQLEALIRYEMQRSRESWALAQTQRANLRGLFGIDF